MSQSTVYLVTIAGFFALIVLFVAASYWYGKKQQTRIQIQAEKRLAELREQGVPEAEARAQTIAEIQRKLAVSQKRYMLILGPIWIIAGVVLILFNGPAILNVVMVVIGLVQLFYALFKKKS